MHRAIVEFGSENSGVRSSQLKGPRYRTGSGRKVDGDASLRKSLGGATGQWLALPARNVHTMIDSDFRAAEHDVSRDPRERFASQSSINHGSENAFIVE